jgi:WD40 repeat protein
LSSAFLLLISLMALAEAFVVWLRWPQFLYPSVPDKVSIGDLSLSLKGEWVASRISFYGRQQKGVIDDVVLCNLHGQEAVRLRIERCRPRCIAVSPVSDDLAITCSDGFIRIWSGLLDCEVGLSVTDERLRPFARTCEHLNCLAFSPDGRLLAAAGDRFVQVWRWPCGELLHKRPRDGRARPYLSFSADSRHILSSGSRGEACLWDAYSGGTAKAVLPDNGLVVSAALSPDAEFAAVFLSDRRMRVYRLANGEELWRETRTSFPGSLITYSPDGRFLAKTASKQEGATIMVFDATGGHIMCELRGHGAPITKLAFAPDGLLYSSDIQGVIRSWNIQQQREQCRFPVLEWGANNRLFYEALDTSIPWASDAR